MQHTNGRGQTISPTRTVLAVSEQNDTLAGLVAQGYNSESIIAAGKQIGITDPKKPLDAGIDLDISSLFPAAVQQAIAGQQNTDYELIRQRVELGNPKLPKVPGGKTIGTSGIDLAMVEKIDEGRGITVQIPINDSLLGMGQCYGFAGLMPGVKPSANIDPRWLFLAPTPPDQKYFGQQPLLPDPGRSNTWLSNGRGT